MDPCNVLYSISRINNVSTVQYLRIVLQNNDSISMDKEKTMGGGLGGVPPPSKDI